MDPTAAFLLGLLAGIALAYLFLLIYCEETRAVDPQILAAWAAECERQAAQAAAVQADYQASAAEYARQVNTVEETPWDARGGSHRPGDARVV